MKITKVTFTTNAQTKEPGRFSVPKKVCDFLGLSNNDPITLLVETDGGHIFLYKGTMVSGLEVYSPETRAHIKAGKRIEVTVFNS